MKEVSYSMILFRPVGLRELELIAESGYKIFPPRLPEQPIFYPVLNFEYAEQIARDWNSKSIPFAGFVTKFQVDDQHARQFPIQVVGGQVHQELWIPAEDLDEFNSHIIDNIEIVATYYGERFDQPLDPATNLPYSVFAAAM
jgi:hypothetical protein